MPIPFVKIVSLVGVPHCEVVVVLVLPLPLGPATPCQWLTDLGGDLVLGAQLAADLGAGQDVLAVLVELELGDDDVGGVEAQGDALAGKPCRG